MYRCVYIYIYVCVCDTWNSCVLYKIAPVNRSACFVSKNICNINIYVLYSKQYLSYAYNNETILRVQNIYLFLLITNSLHNIALNVYIVGQRFYLGNIGKSNFFNNCSLLLMTVKRRRFLERAICASLYLQSCSYGNS